MKTDPLSQTENPVDEEVITPAPHSKSLPEDDPRLNATIQAQQVRKLLVRIKEEGKIGPGFFEWLGS
ncbi:MAG: hypothetical protein V3U37_02825 [Nitrospinaceae bacterium]